MQGKKVGIALSCLSDEDLVRTAPHIHGCKELSQSLQVLNIAARRQGSPGHPAWPQIWDILARCTNLAQLNVTVYQSADLLMLLAAFRRHTFLQLRSMSVGTYGYIPARECVQFLALAPNLQYCNRLPSISNRLNSADVTGALGLPSQLRMANLWGTNEGVLLPLLLAGLCTPREVMLEVIPQLMQHLAAVDWVFVKGFSVSSLTINSARLDNGYRPGPLVSFALACRSLRRLQLCGRAQVIMELLQLLFSDPHCRLNSIELTYGAWGNAHPAMRTWAPPPTMPSFVSMLHSAVSLRALAIHFPPSVINTLVPDLAELSRFCQSRRIVLTMAIVR